MVSQLVEPMNHDQAKARASIGISLLLYQLPGGGGGDCHKWMRSIKRVSSSSVNFNLFSQKLYALPPDSHLYTFLLI